MYAVIRTGGKQYRVTEGEEVDVEKLEAEVGARIELTDVLLLRTEQGVRIGQPTVLSSRVVCEVLRQGRGPKVYSFKFRRRKGSKRLRGHRQSLTRLRVTTIVSESPGSASVPSVSQTA